MQNQEKLVIEYVKVKDLIPYDKNPRKNDPAVDAVAESIKAFGFKNPVILDDRNVIVAGHTRLLAAKKIGLDSVPCIRRSDLTDEEIRAYRVVDNKIGELANWDDGLLAKEMAALPEFNFDAFGFTDSDSESDTTEDDFDPDEEPEEIVVSTGDVWILGEHRLMIGDSTKAEDVKRLMGGELADMVVTDPPYNVNVVAGFRGTPIEKRMEADSDSIENDNMDDGEFRAFLASAFANMKSGMKPGAPFYIWYAYTKSYEFRGALRDEEIQIRECLVWKKEWLTLGRRDYQYNSEPCLYGWKEGAAHPWYSDRKQTTVMKFAQQRKSKMHPTMKPIALFSYLIGNSSKRGDVVMDLFGGSGTTAVCCERMGRRARLMEIDPTYAQRIVNRWEAETGRKAVKE